MKHLTRIAAIAALVLAVNLACGRPATTSAQAPQLGGCTILPANNVWNTAVDTLPVDKNSAAYIANISSTKSTLHPDFSSVAGGNYGIPYNIVPSGQPKLNVAFDYDTESDPGPYPIPPAPKIEDGSDQHLLIVEQGTCKLYETWDTSKNSNGTWRAGSGAIFDLQSNALRPATWTSADAAGLPILPGLARYDEVAAGAINHALRFTTYCTANAYIWPARHKAVPSYCPAQPSVGQPPPMGQRFRLKAAFNISPFSSQTQVILTALKKYGMIVADNGSSWYISGAPDPGWNDDELVSDLRLVHGSDFEAVDESALQLSADSGQVKPTAQDSKSVAPSSASQGQQAIYTIQIVGDNMAVSLADTLPISVTLVGQLATSPAGVPAASYNSTTRTISWSGTPADAVIVKIIYTVTIDLATTGSIANTARIIRSGGQKDATAMLIANPLLGYLPTVRR
jgi:hypothetical protein